MAYSVGTFIMAGQFSSIIEAMQKFMTECRGNDPGEYVVIVDDTGTILAISLNPFLLKVHFYPWCWPNYFKCCLCLCRCFVCYKLNSSIRRKK
jgi:hypothetical protein